MNYSSMIAWYTICGVLTYFLVMWSFKVQYKQFPNFKVMCSVLSLRKKALVSAVFWWIIIGGLILAYLKKALISAWWNIKVSNINK